MENIHTMLTSLVQKHPVEVLGELEHLISSGAVTINVECLTGYAAARVGAAQGVQAGLISVLLLLAQQQPKTASASKPAAAAAAAAAAVPVPQKTVKAAFDSTYAAVLNGLGAVFAGDRPGLINFIGSPNDRHVAWSDLNLMTAANTQTSLSEKYTNVVRDLDDADKAQKIKKAISALDEATDETCEQLFGNNKEDILDKLSKKRKAPVSAPKKKPNQK